MTYEEFNSFTKALETNPKYSEWTFIMSNGSCTLQFEKNNVIVGLYHNGVWSFIDGDRQVSNSEVDILFARHGRGPVHTLGKIETIEELRRITFELLKCTDYPNVVIYEHNYKTEKTLGVLD